MKIEIDYNGAGAVCKVNGKYLYQCDSLTIAQTFSAFRTIEQHFRREGKLPKEEQSLDKVRESKELLFAFAKRMGFKITDIRNLSLTLKEIILAYRKINKFPTAFNKYIKRFCNDNKC